MVVNMLKFLSKEKIKERLQREVKITKEQIERNIEETKKRLKRLKNGLVNQVYLIIKPEDELWNIIKPYQESGKLPKLLQEVYVYTELPGRYERGVAEMEKYTEVVKVTLIPPLFPYTLSPHCDVRVLHHTCLNPRKGRLHIFLEKGYDIEDLFGLLHYYKIFTPPKYL